MWSIDEVLEKLKSRGYKLTGQRKAIIEKLCGRKDHPTAEQLYSELQKSHPAISFATIYSTVQLLAEMGFLQILTIDDKKTHFDPSSETHAHFFCQRCGLLEDIDMSQEERDKLKRLSKYRARSMQVYLYGLCHECDKK
ncbi:MAG TPA: Fur family transcriptional regulator [Acetomicrobium sp.]|nr:Fur family transcriptional regulator [Acetomicrobium sp.]HXK99551.1 Fur family transcriptional regulator [Acetomicrobium sp.]